MMESLKIIYIDDNPDSALSKYLNEYQCEICNFEFSEIIFNPEEGYESLINDPRIISSNIIFIDSKLFEDRNATLKKFTGEEFKIILKKFFPFIEVIVITQNEKDNDYTTISKYDSKCNKKPEDYYDINISNVIKRFAKNIIEVRKIASKIEENKSWEKVMVEKIVNSINGQDIYDELTKSDIDNVIMMFCELQKKVEG